jgi:hypothetical protein
MELTMEPAEETAPAPPPLPAAAAKPVIALAQLPVSFSNPVAIRVAFLMALATFPVELMPGLSFLILLWWMAAGCFAVLLYRRLTGSALSVRAGARLGSITGVLSFVGIAIVFTVSMLFMGNEFSAQMDLAAKANPAAAQLIHDPMMMFLALLIGLAMMAAAVVGLCAAGGALGARFFTARKPS